jgi:uncharacterized membrane protein YccF (DUF307 family)
MATAIAAAEGPRSTIVWFVLAGLWLFVGYAFAAPLCFILIIAIRFGVASLRIALYGVWPFGRAVVPQTSRASDRRWAT